MGSNVPCSSPASTPPETGERTGEHPGDEHHAVDVDTGDRRELRVVRDGPHRLADSARARSSATSRSETREMLTATTCVRASRIDPNSYTWKMSTSYVRCSALGEQEQEVPEHERQPDSGHEEGEEPRPLAAHGAPEPELEDNAQDGRRDDREERREDDGVAPGDVDDEGGVGAEGEIVAVREVDDAQDPVDERDSDGGKSDDRARHDAVREELDELAHARNHHTQSKSVVRAGVRVAGAGVAREELRMSHALPGLTRADHVALTIPDLDEGVAFYTGVLGGRELYRLGPFDAAEIPPMADGRDWTEAHVNVAGARLRFAVIRLGDDFNVELFEYERPAGAPTAPGNADVGGHHLGLKVTDLDAALAFLQARGVRTFERIEVGEGPSAGMRGAYFLDPWGNHLELVEYDRLGYMDEEAAA